MLSAWKVSSRRRGPAAWAVLSADAARRISLLSQPWGRALTTHRQVSVSFFDLLRAVEVRPQEGQSWDRVSQELAALIAHCEQGQHSRVERWWESECSGPSKCAGEGALKVVIYQAGEADCYT